jgi:hypothetical protein
MGDKKQPKKEKTGHYLIGSALLWAGGLWAVEWFVNYESSLWRAFMVAAGGLLTGFTSALILGRIAKWGANYKILMGLGIVLGVAIASGAVTGIRQFLSGIKPDAIKVDWDSFKAFLLSVAVVPAAALGLVTGVYVRSSIPRPKTK